MRRALVLIPLLVACAKTETAKTDSSAAAPAAAAAALTEADIAGTWTGTAMAAGTDSIISHWTQVCANGTCKGTSTEQPKDTITSTYMLMADSAMGTSQPTTMPGMKDKVIDNWTVHLSGGRAVGTGKFTLASKPDSVVAQYRFEGARKP